MQIVRIKDGPHVAERMSGDRRNLGFRCSRECESGDGSTSQIVEGDADDPGFCPRLGERRSKPVRCPRLAFGSQENDGAQARRGIQRDLERGADRNADSRSGLALPEPYGFSVIRGPCQAEKVAFALARPQRQQDRKVKVRRRGSLESCLIVTCPDLVGTTSPIEAASAFAGIFGDESAVFGP
jgi:hypothetical protein